MRRSYRSVIVLALLGLLAGSLSTPVQAKVGKSLVVGGIEPCSGLPPSMVKNLPRYAAGTVVVLAGRITRSRRGGFSLPRRVVARETVKVNTRYRFALFPGHYVLIARMPHANVRPFVEITVREGMTVRADIPNMCK
jgi:hypothetical protein